MKEEEGTKGYLKCMQEVHVTREEREGCKEAFLFPPQRGYVFRQNPVVKVFPDASGTANNFGLQLAINTNQFGRTFQDR